MIEVRIHQREKQIYAFQIDGHAQMGKHGEDLVCAAVSGIAQTAVIGLIHYLKKEVKFEHEAGKLYATILSGTDLETEAILQTMLLGIEEIAKEYPKAVKILKIN